MTDDAISSALTREHDEIDSGIKTFIESLDDGSVRSAAMTSVLDALRRHIYLEEAILFPPIRDAGVVMPIFVMLREHGELWRTMDTLAALLADGADAGILGDTCRHLLDQLAEHNAKEEPIIYPHADVDLPPDTRAELEVFITGGATPQGWVCEQGPR